MRRSLLPPLLDNISFGRYRRCVTARREARQLAKKAEQQGWIVDYTNGGHLRYKAPTGKIFFFSSTPSDMRSLKNQMSLMSKYGFVK